MYPSNQARNPLQTYVRLHHNRFGRTEIPIAVQEKKERKYPLFFFDRLNPEIEATGVLLDNGHGRLHATEPIYGTDRGASPS